MKLSNIIGKQIYSVYEQMKIGTILNANLNEKGTKLLGFYFFDENEDEHYILFKNIYKLNDVVLIKNFEAIEDEYPIEDCENLLYKNIININGQSYGKLQDFNFNENGKIISYISSLNKIIDVPLVKSHNDFILLGDKIKLNNFKPKNIDNVKINALENVKVSIMKMPEPENDNICMPPKITVPLNTFIGKIAREDLFGQNHELIIRKNQNITEKALELIKQHNKINQLYHICY